MISWINHTGLTVSSLERALAFYRDALTGYPNAHVRMAHLVTPAGQRLELFEYLEPRGRTVPGDPCDVGITHVCLVVADVHAAYRQLVAAGAEPFS